MEQKELILSKNPSAAMNELIIEANQALHSYQESAMSHKQQLDELKETMTHIMSPESFAKKKSFDSYALMGIEAMDVTKERKLDNPKNGKPIYVGPEIGWASESYGGHPDEFIQLIEESRKEMAKKLVEERRMTPEAAKQAAKTHIMPGLYKMITKSYLSSVIIL